MFNIGQKVVCIKGTTSVCDIKLIEGNIYTVKNNWSCNCSTVLDVGLRIHSDDFCFKETVK